MNQSLVKRIYIIFRANFWHYYYKIFEYVDPTNEFDKIEQFKPGDVIKYKRSLDISNIYYMPENCHPSPALSFKKEVETMNPGAIVTYRARIEDTRSPFIRFIAEINKENDKKIVTKVVRCDHYYLYRPEAHFYYKN